MSAFPQSPTPFPQSVIRCHHNISVFDNLTANTVHDDDG